MNLEVLPRRRLPPIVHDLEGGNLSAHRSTEQLIFFATHELTPVDVRLFRHYSRQLRYSAHPSLARLWVLLYRPAENGVGALIQESTMVEAGVCVWGNAAMQRALPALYTNATRISINTPNPNHRRYFWFHSSLLLWNRTFGHACAPLESRRPLPPRVLIGG